jgi:hypothetical protein
LAISTFRELWQKRLKSYLKKAHARHQWLTPVILATQKAQIRRIAVQASMGK